MPPSPMIGTSRGAGHGGAQHDRGELRDADAGHDARGADAAGADAHLHAVRARLDERGRSLGRGHVAGQRGRSQSP